MLPRVVILGVELPEPWESTMKAAKVCIDLSRYYLLQLILTSFQLSIVSLTLFHRHGDIK